MLTKSRYSNFLSNNHQSDSNKFMINQARQNSNDIISTNMQLERTNKVNFDDENEQKDDDNKNILELTNYQ